jgi:L-fuconolactonase
LRGLEAMAGFDLTYELFPRHLSVAIQLVRQFPHQRFVLDHLGKPFIKAGMVSPWDDDMRALAGFENVYCKVSGLVTEAAWWQWKAEAFKPYLDVAFSCFGADRLMFGSDWPVCTLAADYMAVVRLVRDYLRPLSEDVQDKVFGRNAVEIYRLRGPQNAAGSAKMKDE